MTRVIDASVALKWVLPAEASSEAARRLLDDEDAMIAPDLLVIEAANALWRKVLQRDVTGAEADLALGALMAGALDLRSTPPLVRRASSLARHLRHPVYDCVYLALAEQERCPLITADTRLLALARNRRLGVTIVGL